MTVPALHLGLQLDLYALFNRPELSRISETNRRVNAIIEKHFASSPRLVFDYVFYKRNGVCMWSDDVDLNEYMNVGAAASPMSDSQIAQLSTSKFLRFRQSTFILNKEYPLDQLEAHKHLWIDSRLTVFASDFWHSTELPQLASLVNTSHDLDMSVPAALDMLPQLFQGSVKHIEITDNCFTLDSSNANTTADSISYYKKQLPVNDITNFLFNNACKNNECRAFHLRISTNFTLEYWQELVDSIKQKNRCRTQNHSEGTASKFLDTPDPSEFHFYMFDTTDWHQENWTLEHKHSKKNCATIVLNMISALTAMSVPFLNDVCGVLTREIVI